MVAVRIFRSYSAKARNIIPNTVRDVECIKKFINVYKTLLLSTMSNDESYQTNNAYDRFYPVVITGN